LWPETVQGLRAAIAERPEPKRKEYAGLVFLNARGLPWVRNTEKSRTDTISVQFGELLKSLGLHRDSVGFYTLRHVHRTIADGARDPVVADLIMGHSDASMAAHYRERMDDDRIRAVAEHVRQWLYGAPNDGGDTHDDQDTSETSSEVIPLQPVEGKEDRPALKLYVG
jgi:integrase